MEIDLRQTCVGLVGRPVWGWLILRFEKGILFLFSLFGSWCYEVGTVIVSA
jgi:hypothetical protein